MTHPLSIPPVKRLFVAAFSTVSVLASQSATSEAQAPGTAYPASFSIEEKLIQKAPTQFKLQARISQAKLPVGDAEFSVIKVMLVTGQTESCTETFNNVKVQDSVLNLEIGRGMKCSVGGVERSFGDVVAASNDVGFRVCIGGDQNCLKPISLASVPYAVKASYANQAQLASRANTAVQCNYAHRVTADKNLYLTQKVGDGYYDFHTPTSLDGLGLPSSNAGGFIQWTPVNSAGNTLHLCGNDGSKLRKLALLMFHADQTEIRGDAAIQGIASAKGGIRAGEVKESRSEKLVVEGATLLRGDTTIAGALNAGSTTVTELLANGNANVAGGITVSGHADSNTSHSNKFFAGVAPANMSLLSDALTVNGSSAFTGLSVFKGGTTRHEDDVVFTGNVFFKGRVDMPNSSTSQSDVVGAAVLAKTLKLGTPADIINGKCPAGTQLVDEKCAWKWDASTPAYFSYYPFEVTKDGTVSMARDLFVGGSVYSNASIATTGSLSASSVTAAGSIIANGNGKFASVTTTGLVSTTLNTSGEGRFGSINASGAVGAASFRADGAVTAGGKGTFGAVETGALTVNGPLTFSKLDLGLEVVKCDGDRTTQSRGFRCACPGTKKVIAGGVDCSTTLFHLYTSRPSDDGNAWEGACWSGNTTYGNTEQYRANYLWAICAQLTSTASAGPKSSCAMPPPVAESWTGVRQVTGVSSGAAGGDVILPADPELK